MVRGAAWLFVSSLLSCPTSLHSIHSASLFEFVDQVTEVSPKSFSRHAESSVPWVLNCYSPGCGHCKRFAPVVSVCKSVECRWAGRLPLYGVASVFFAFERSKQRSYITSSPLRPNDTKLSNYQLSEEVRGRASKIYETLLCCNSPVFMYYKDHVVLVYRREYRMV